MKERDNGTCPNTPQTDLRWGADYDKANTIACFNRRYAESKGYWEGDTVTFKADNENEESFTYYDSITGKPLYVGPVGRTMAEFIAESEEFGWPSFRDEETVWDNVRVLWDGEVVSKDGSHLGHNLPDELGNRYCINLVCIAGNSV